MRVYIPDLMALLMRVDTGAPSRAVAPRSAKDDVFVRIGGTNTFAQVQERVLPRDVVADALVAVEWHGELLILDITAPEPEALGPYGFEMLLEVGGIRRLVDGVGRQKRQLVYSFNGETFEIVEPVVAIGRVLAKVPCSGNSLPAETRT